MILLLPLGLYVILLGIGGGLSEKTPLPETLKNRPRPLLIAHRGTVDQYPENSLGAIKQAMERGYQAVEIDIQFSADSQFVVCHETDAGDLLGISDEVTGLSVEQLKQQPIIFNGELSDQFIPTLAEVFDLYGDTLLFYLDMKRWGHDDFFTLTNDIAELIKKHNMTDRVLIASAHVWFIAWLEYTHPELVTILEGFPTENPWVWPLVPRGFRANMIASREILITQEFAGWLRENDMSSRYIPYHVRQERVSRLLNWGIEMLMVDDNQFYNNLLPDNEKPPPISQ